MTALGRSLATATTELRALGRQFALVGGLAVSVRCEPRLTRDADLAVAVSDDADAEAIVRQLLRRGYRLIAMVEQDAANRLATARMVRDDDTGSIITDLLFASCGIEPEIVEAAEPIEILQELIVPVATTGDLIAMKLLARDDRRRPADADDLRGLALVASASDWERAAYAVELIARRGFARGRDLEPALARLREFGAY